MRKDVRETVLKTYDTVTDGSLWPELLQQFAEQIGAVGCVVFEWQGLRSERSLEISTYSSNYDPKELKKYVEKHFKEESRDQDVFESHSLMSDGIDLIQDDVLAPSIEDLKLLANVIALQKRGILHRAAGLLNKDNAAQSRFSVQLAVGRGRLNDEERQHMGVILPHIAKALDLGRPAKQLAQEHQGMMAAMDRLTIGVCVLDGRGSVVVENEEFRRQKEIHRVFQIAKNGSLRFMRSQDQSRFEALKEDALNHGRFGARPRKEAIAADDDTFLCMEITPLTKSEEIGSSSFGGFIVYSTDTSLPVKCQTLPIKYAYGLTDAEMALVDAIADGLTNVQIAEKRDRAVPTINAQVKSILSKTHCGTRTQFVRLMTSFGADYLVDDDETPSA